MGLEPYATRDRCVTVTPILLMQYTMGKQSQIVWSPIQFLTYHHVLTCNPCLSPTFCPSLLYMPSWHLFLSTSACVTEHLNNLVVGFGALFQV
jgi:hypothetical protein